MDQFLEDRGRTECLLSPFSYVSFHGPKGFHGTSEYDVAHRLQSWATKNRNVVMHADCITRPDCWKGLRDSLLIENMDMRKHTGRTADELADLFDSLPEAGLCFDIGHARHVDRTMTRAEEILRRFGDRLRLLHISDVATGGEHRPLSRMAMMSYASVAHLIPEDIPAIMESPVSEQCVHAEIERIGDTFEDRELRLVAG